MTRDDTQKFTGAKLEQAVIELRGVLIRSDLCVVTQLFRAS